MRVLQINSVCGIGSTGRIATDIHAILKENGHKSYIAYGRDEDKNCNTAIKIGNKLDNYMHVAKTRIFDKHGFGSKKATKRFIKKIENIKPDIIHLHNIHGYYINIEILFKYLKKVNKPVIWTLHDCWPFTGHCAYFDYNGCKCWTGKHTCIQKNSYPSSIVFNNSLRNYKRKKKAFTGIKNLTIVTPSKWLAELVENSFLSEYPVKVINNGIDLELFQYRPSKFRDKYNIEDKFLILGVANIWDERKGFKYFIELASKLNDDECIVLVGLSEKQIKELPKNIIGITQTNNVEELVELYSTADVFINPTLEDNFPTTNIEALACGTPVISFNTGGSIESIDDLTGFIVEQGDLTELMKKIQLIKQADKEDYFNNCVNKSKKLYNKENKFYEYLNLYEESVDG